MYSGMEAVPSGGAKMEPSFYIQSTSLVKVFKALTLVTVHGRLIFHTWEQIEKLVAEGKVDVKKVVSHRVPMSRFEDAFKALFSGEACKILLDPSK